MAPPCRQGGPPLRPLPRTCQSGSQGGGPDQGPSLGRHCCAPQQKTSSWQQWLEAVPPPLAWWWSPHHFNAVVPGTAGQLEAACGHGLVKPGSAWLRQLSLSGLSGLAQARSGMGASQGWDRPNLWPTPPGHRRPTNVVLKHTTLFKHDETVSSAACVFTNDGGGPLLHGLWCRRSSGIVQVSCLCGACCVPCLPCT